MSWKVHLWYDFEISLVSFFVCDPIYRDACLYDFYLVNNLGCGRPRSISSSTSSFLDERLGHLPSTHARCDDYLIPPKFDDKRAVSVRTSR